MRESAIDSDISNTDSLSFPESEKLSSSLRFNHEVVVVWSDEKRGAEVRINQILSFF